MDHYYEFFDRAFFDSVWALSWCDFQRKHRSRWAMDRNYEPGVYSGRSLRELICFSMEPEPSPELLEDVLARRTIRWTVRRSSPQFFLMSEIMRHVPGSRARICCAFDIPSEDVGVLISAALGGFVAGQLAGPILQAVLKLHGCPDPREWVTLSARERKMLGALTSRVDVLQPIYAWQGESACGDEEWANCLGLADSRRFALFVTRAWRENWPVTGLKQPPQRLARRPGIKPHFREFPVTRELRKAIERASRFERPSVFRRWC